MLEWWSPNVPPSAPVASTPPFSVHPDGPDKEIQDNPGKARRESAPKAAFTADGWTAAGVYTDGIWTSKLLSFSASLKPDDLVGQIVSPTNDPGNYLRAEPPRAAGSRGREIGVIEVGDRLEIGEVRAVPSTTSGLSVWVAVRRTVP